MQTATQKYLNEVEAHNATKRELSGRTAVLHELLKALAEHPEYADIRENVDKGNFALAAADVKKRIKRTDDKFKTDTWISNELLGGIFPTESKEADDTSHISPEIWIPDADFLSTYFSETDDSDDDFSVITF